MTPDVVVDIGNSRMKWGRCLTFSSFVDNTSRYPRYVNDMEALPLGSPGEWNTWAALWGLRSPSTWVVASVNPPETDRFRQWSDARGDRCVVLDDKSLIPIRSDVDERQAVGIDRLLNAAAAVRWTDERPLAVVSAGTAVTVDFVDASGTFVGGAILPGVRMMLDALHRRTAALPEVVLESTVYTPVGRNTADAIRAGVFWAVAGGVRMLNKKAEPLIGGRPKRVWLTGGDAFLLLGYGVPGSTLADELTLDGIWLTAREML